MNEPHDQPDSGQADFLRRLANMAPVQSQTDPSGMFYQAGYAAAMAQSRRKQIAFLRVSAAAMLCALCVVGVVSYQAGRSRSVSELAGPGVNSQAVPTPSTQQSPLPSQIPSPIPRDASMAPSIDNSAAGPTPKGNEVVNSEATGQPVPRGLLASWLTRALPSPTERRLSLVGAKEVSGSTNETALQSPELPAHHSLDQSATEPVWRRGDWQIMLPTL